MTERQIRFGERGALAPCLRFDRELTLPLAKIFGTTREQLA